MDGWNIGLFLGPPIFRGIVLVSEHFLTPKLEGNLFLKRLGPTSGNFTSQITTCFLLVMLWIDAIMWLCSWRVSQYVGIVVFDQKWIFSKSWCQFFTPSIYTRSLTTPEKWWLEDYFPFGWLIFRGMLNFQGGMFISSQFQCFWQSWGWALRRILWSNVLHVWENKMSSCWRHWRWWLVMTPGSPWKFNSSPLKISRAPKGKQSSNHHFSGASC